MTSKIVELTVVGIRNYCPGGNDGLPALFQRLPVGKTLYLKINPPGSKFPGAVSVYDGIGKTVGSISKTDRRYIELAIPQDGMLPCTVVGHSLEDHCLFVEAENNVGIKDPYIRKTTAEPGELIFSTTSEDEHLKTLTQLMKTQLAQPAPDLQELLELTNEYASVCCTSLDGETSFSRADILRELKKVNAQNGMFDEVISRIYEDTKDLGRRNEDVKVRVYRSQYERILASAHAKKNGRASELETYVKTLAFGHGGNLTEDVIRAEVKTLSEQLVHELMGGFVQAIETDKDFATALYSLNYSLHSIYIMYTRRIKREYLINMLKEEGIAVDRDMELAPSAEAVSQPTGKPRGPRKKYLFVLDGCETKENVAVKLREKQRLCDYISKHGLDSSKLMCTKDDALNKAIVCFLLLWVKKGYTAPNPSGGALYRFLTEDCRIMSDVQEKAYANRIKEWIKPPCEYDAEVMIMVKGVF